jgi:hypothetical protein
MLMSRYTGGFLADAEEEGGDEEAAEVVVAKARYVRKRGEMDGDVRTRGWIAALLSV